jgi:diguanylate cyclase (GGDEF)-like protein
MGWRPLPITAFRAVTRIDDRLLNRAIANRRSGAGIRPEERRVAGRVGGAVWVIGSVTIILLALVLPEAPDARSAAITIGAAGAVWGLISLLVLDYRRAPWWLFHLSTAAGAGTVTAAIELTGDARSPALACLFYVVVFAAYFYRPLVAATYIVACEAIQAIVVLGSPSGVHPQGIAVLIVATPALAILGAAIVSGKAYMWRVRRRSEELAAEQSALRRVATAVVNGESPERFYLLVATEVGCLLGATGAGILRLDSPEMTTALGTWADDPAKTYPYGTRIPVRAGGALVEALAVDRPVRVDHESPESATGQLGYGSSIVAPIKVSGEVWGVLAVAAGTAHGFTVEHERRLTEFGDLLASAIASIEDRAKLAAQAATDGLTGLANHRTFRERLGSDLARARRHQTPLSMAVIDIDRFKLINDLGGHEAGDEMLLRVARCLTSAARTEDTLARVGGDEFAWILPETTREQALVAVQRAREEVAAIGDPMCRMTISAGICDSSWTADPIELVRLADRALYASKEHGRDQVRIYSPDTADELAAL